MSSIAGTLNVPVAVAVGVLALAVLQIGVQIYALIDLARRRRVTGGMRWVWLLVILFGNLVGAIVYLAVGRPAPPAIEPEHESGRAPGERARDAADLLYGPDEPR